MPSRHHSRVLLGEQALSTVRSFHRAPACVCCGRRRVSFRCLWCGNAPLWVVNVGLGDAPRQRGHTSMHCWGEGAGVDVILNQQHLRSSHVSSSAKQQGHCSHSQRCCPRLPLHMALETALTREGANLLEHPLLPTCVACASAVPCAEAMSTKHMLRGLLRPTCSRNLASIAARPCLASVSVSLSPIWPSART